ncbi:MAG: hypothetical protein J7L55_02205 [Desulfurococcales archaeon]|nr:hypothetical protein [Desulfurococcales archaeon]
MWVDDVVSLTESILMEFLLKYGERGKAVLRAALEVAEEYSASGGNIAGHFDFKGLVTKLEEMGFRYNPSQLLRIMEREYGIIETTYKTSTRRWYSFTDLEAVREVLDRFDGGSDIWEDPEVELLKIQMGILDLESLHRKIMRLSRGDHSSLRFREETRKIVFEELPYVVKVLKEAMKYEELFPDFIAKASEVLRLSKELVARSRRGSQLLSAPSVEVGGVEERG